jgi:benzoate-CoA ligase
MSIPSPVPGATFNFAQYIIDSNASRPNKTACIDDQGKLSYGELASHIRLMASALKSLDVRREERVFLFMHDCNDWPVAYLGAMYAGVVPVCINTLLPATDVAYMLEHSRSQIAIVSAALLPVLEEAMKNSANEIKSVVVSNRANAPLNTALKTLDMALLLEACDEASAPAATVGDDPGFWLYSSGSTGRPKGTVHTQANPYWTAELYAKPVLQLRESDVCFSAAKLFFAYGLGNGLSFPFSVGATAVYMAERPTPDACFKRWLDHQPTVYFGAPTGYAGMLASPNLPKRSDVSLRMCSSAGEALPQDIGERFTKQYGAQIIDGIGSTEMLHIFLSNRPGDVRYGTTGKPVEGYEVELRGEDGHAVADGEVGDLYIKGPSSATMYWSSREKSRDTFRGEWTKSGDKYSRDADGYYTYAGRSDDMLKVSGQYVSPFEVEATLIQHASVLEAAVIGVADDQGLTKVKAYVVLKPGVVHTAALEDEIKAFVKSKLTPHKYPRNMAFVTELPKTATGKIQRFKLRDLEAQSKA